MLDPLTPQTPRLSDRRHPLAAAIEVLQQKQEAETTARRHESGANHRATNERVDTIEEATAEAFKDLKKSLSEITVIAQATLIQAEKTNVRVGVLEASVGVEDDKGLRGRTAVLEKDRTRMLQSLFVIGVFVSIIVWAWGEEIRQRGVLNPSAVETTRMIDAVIERRVQSAALKPSP